MDLGNKLKLLRERAGMSQQELADRMGTTQQTISRLEKGITPLDLKRIDEICAIFSVPPSYFVDTQAFRAGPQAGGADPLETTAGGEVVELITMAIDVLRSRTHYAESLEKNIRSFHRGVALERVASEREQRLEERVDQLEREIRRITHLGPPGEHAEPFPPPGAPEKSGPQDARPERGPGSSTE